MTDEQLQKEKDAFMQEMLGDSFEHLNFDQKQKNLVNDFSRICNKNNLAAIVAIGDFSDPENILMGEKEIFNDEIPYGALEMLICSLIQSRTMKAIKENTEGSFTSYESFIKQLEEIVKLNKKVIRGIKTGKF